MNVPVLLIIFNRPDTTQKVFQAIARARPTQLFIAADGPRQDKAGEAEACAMARGIVKQVNWPCELKTNFSDINLGCGRHPANAITWVFNHVDRAVILEDDCVPHETFFQFCSELLEQYYDDPRIMQIASNNWHFRKRPTQYSYFFSRHIIAAGAWATWRRAWAHYDITIKDWPSYRQTRWLQEIVEHPVAMAHFHALFDWVFQTSGDNDVWDCQWTFACWAQQALSILPSVTLASNIGFGHPKATHTTSASDSLAMLTGFLKIKPMKFPLNHPTEVKRLTEADRFIMETTMVPSWKPVTGFQANIRKTWINFLNAHPSLKSREAFWKRIRRINLPRQVDQRTQRDESRTSNES